MEDTIFDESGCPKCGGKFVHRVKWTWWGGVLGPKILKHTKCDDCKFTYNEKSRASNNKNIVILLVVSTAIGAAIGGALIALKQ